MPANAGPNKYSHTPRRVFEKAMEQYKAQVDRKLQRLREDLAAIREDVRRIIGLLA